MAPSWGEVTVPVSATAACGAAFCACAGAATIRAPITLASDVNMCFARKENLPSAFGRKTAEKTQTRPTLHEVEPGATGGRHPRRLVTLPAKRALSCALQDPLVAIDSRLEVVLGRGRDRGVLPGGRVLVVLGADDLGGHRVAPPVGCPGTPYRGERLRVIHREGH